MEDQIGRRFSTLASGQGHGALALGPTDHVDNFVRKTIPERATMALYGLWSCTVWGAVGSGNRPGKQKILHCGAKFDRLAAAAGTAPVGPVATLSRNARLTRAARESLLMQKKIESFDGYFVRC
jgi:hypothetical protein